jgi:hypothetical protein
VVRGGAWYAGDSAPCRKGFGRLGNSLRPAGFRGRLAGSRQARPATGPRSPGRSRPASNRTPSRWSSPPRPGAPPRRSSSSRPGAPPRRSSLSRPGDPPRRSSLSRPGAPVGRACRDPVTRPVGRACRDPVTAAHCVPRDRAEASTSGGGQPRSGGTCPEPGPRDPCPATPRRRGIRNSR